MSECVAAPDPVHELSTLSISQCQHAFISGVAELRDRTRAQLLITKTFRRAGASADARGPESRSSDESRCLSSAPVGVSRVLTLATCGYASVHA